MRAVVVFESIFGNTQQIAKAIAVGLRERFEVTVVEVGEAPRDLSGIGLVVVGGPTHVWGMSRPTTRAGAREEATRKDMRPVSAGVGIRDWLAGLPTAEIACAAFDTALRRTGWMPVGSAAKGEAAALRRKGYRMLAEPQQFYVEGSDGPLVEGEVERATAWGRALGLLAVESGKTGG